MTTAPATAKASASSTLNTAFRQLIIASTAAETEGNEDLATQLNDFAMRNFRMRQTLTRKPREPKATK